MWKDEFDCSESDSPSNDPVPMGFDRFCWFSSSKMEFKFSEVLNGSGVSRSGVHSSKNGIQVDRFSGDDIVPFNVRKFWYSFGAEDFEFHEFKVEGVILDHFPHKFLAGGEESVVG